MLGNYLYELRALSQIKRFQNKKKTSISTVVDHRLFTAKTVKLLLFWIQNMNEFLKTPFLVDEETVLMKAILSNTHKIYMGEVQFDITRYKNIKTSLQEVSEIVYDTNYKELLPNYLEDRFKSYVLTSDLSVPENFVVKISSLITTMIECLDELQNNNTTFVPIFFETLTQLINCHKTQPFPLLSIFLLYGVESILSHMDIMIVDYSKVRRMVSRIKFEQQEVFSHQTIEVVLEGEKKEVDFIEGFVYTFCQYIVQMKAVKHITRFQNKFKLKTRTVAEHEYFVALASLLFGLSENILNEKDYDLSRLISIALFHDDIEGLTGDILSGTKRCHPKLDKAISKVETAFYNSSYREMFPCACDELYRNYILNPKDDTKEGFLISAMDTVDVLFESIEELNLGNFIFSEVYESSMDKLMKYGNIPTLMEFLSESVPNLLSVYVEDNEVIS